MSFVIITETQMREIRNNVFKNIVKKAKENNIQLKIMNYHDDEELPDDKLCVIFHNEEFEVFLAFHGTYITLHYKCEDFRPLDYLLKDKLEKDCCVCYENCLDINDSTGCAQCANFICGNCFKEIVKIARGNMDNVNCPICRFAIIKV